MEEFLYVLDAQTLVSARDFLLVHFRQVSTVFLLLLYARKEKY